ncbi:MULTISPECIES: ArsR/SmtB family transcription factor [Streptomyces]|uniref:ArsR/SmtB family transcription factor n=1 Tax=Streptomyces TaxID=1883 RepID=UPI001E34951C|nr:MULTISPECIES: metalloregulator ArsR/SmtB family transcription factor [Streptomyces]MCC9706589.1 metalloregulator ArsR/SmtB family transcription factor [Streptomyces sp. MNU76]WSG23615.1 metalloregulator ArsR/SmtB family transcription factor [Streptomyces europaeiscabiei]
MAITAFDAAEAVTDDAEAETCTPALACLLIDRDEAERLASMLKAIADPTRLQILRLVERAPSGEACVCDLADCLGFRQPTISHHLKVMTEAGLLNRERRGTWSWYSVNLDGLRRVREILEPLPR